MFNIFKPVITVILMAVVLVVGIVYQEQSHAGLKYETLKERYARQDTEKVCRHYKIELRACRAGRQASCNELIANYRGFTCYK